MGMFSLNHVPTYQGLVDLAFGEHVGSPDWVMGRIWWLRDLLSTALYPQLLLTVTSLRPVLYFPDMSGWTSGLIFFGKSLIFFPDIHPGMSGGDFENYAEPTTCFSLFLMSYSLQNLLFMLMIIKIHNWKSLANRLTCDQKALFTVTHALFFISLICQFLGMEAWRIISLECLPTMSFIRGPRWCSYSTEKCLLDSHLLFVYITILLISVWYNWKPNFRYPKFVTFGHKLPKMVDNISSQIHHLVNTVLDVG